ncbi:MAG: hypothetical protein ACRD1T_02430 [Acidimicrobiia bacterium]
MSRVVKVAVISILALPASTQADILAVGHNGIVLRIDEATGLRVRLGSSGLVSVPSLARDGSGRFFTISRSVLDPVNKLYTINPDTGAARLVIRLNFAGLQVSVRALAFSPNNILYASVFFPSSLWTIDIATGEATFIGAMARPIEGLAFSADGTLFGYGSFTKSQPAALVTIHTVTGAFLSGTARIGDINTLAFAPDGTLYAGADGIGALDPSTGLYIPGTSWPTGFEVQGMEFFDRNAPLVDAAVTRPLLWPSGGTLNNVGLGVGVSDPTANIQVQVFADDGAGSSDAAELGPGTLLLRSANNAPDGRVYLIVVTATDAGGRMGFELCTVVVPHSENPEAVRAVLARAAAAETFYRVSHALPPEYSLIGVGPND